MELFESTLGLWVWKAIILVIFCALMKGIMEGAINSWKRSRGKFISVLDEVIEGVIGLALFVIVMSVPPTQAITWVTTLVSFVWGLVSEVLRSFLNIPV